MMTNIMLGSKVFLLESVKWEVKEESDIDECYSVLTLQSNQLLVVNKFRKAAIMSYFYFLLSEADYTFSGSKKLFKCHICQPGM